MRIFPFATLALAFSLGACANTIERLSEVGEQPKLAAISVLPNQALGRTVSLPMPVENQQPRQANALWKAGSRSFFRDPRASKVGDILTVDINIGDTANISNTTARSRKNSEDANADNLLGYETKLSSILPSAVDPTSLVKAGSDSSSTGSGSVQRSETINLTVAAVVTQVLPNGNLVIEGHQEVAVNFEKRQLTVSGVVRPEDISNANTIQHTQIAEARISYGGQGQITDVQQPRYGQQVFDAIFPF